MCHTATNCNFGIKKNIYIYVYISSRFNYLYMRYIFQYISNKIQLYTVYLYLESILHVSGGTSTHHQERIQMYLQHLVFVTIFIAIVADSSNGVINTRCCRYSCLRS